MGDEELNIHPENVTGSIEIEEILVRRNKVN